MTAETLLFTLIRAAFFGTPVAEPIKAACTPEMLEELYPLAKSHDVAHLVGQALDKLGLPDSQPFCAGNGRTPAAEHYRRLLQLASLFWGRV